MPRASLRLVATGTVYYSQNDEQAFFEWLGRIGCIGNLSGQGLDLVIKLKRRPTKRQLLELLAIFYRYHVEMSQLSRFRTAENASWFEDPQNYWHPFVFGGRLRVPDYSDDDFGACSAAD